MTRPRTEPAGAGPSVSLAEVLDRLLECGVTVDGNATIGVAGVELIYLDLRLLLASVDTAYPNGKPLPPPRQPAAGPAPLPPSPPHSAPLPPPAQAAAAPAPPVASAVLWNGTGMPREQSREDVAKGVVRFALTLMNLLHVLMEKQAVRRMAHGNLSEAEIDRLGTGLQAQAQAIGNLRRQFGLTEAELDFRLGGFDGNAGLAEGMKS